MISRISGRLLPDARAPPGQKGEGGMACDRGRGTLTPSLFFFLVWGYLLELLYLTYPSGKVYHYARVIERRGYQGRGNPSIVVQLCKQGVGSIMTSDCACRAHIKFPRLVEAPPEGRELCAACERIVHASR